MGNAIISCAEQSTPCHKNPCGFDGSSARGTGDVTMIQAVERMPQEVWVHSAEVLSDTRPARMKKQGTGLIQGEEFIVVLDKSEHSQHSPRMALSRQCSCNGFQQVDSAMSQLGKNSRATQPRLGINVDGVTCRDALPITGVAGGLAQSWNEAHPKEQMLVGDLIVEVNGMSGDTFSMMELCKREQLLRMTVIRGGARDYIFG